MDFGCTCIPKWLLAETNKTCRNVCVSCEKPLGRSGRSQLLGYPCAIMPGRVHCATILYCAKRTCLHNFHNRHEEKGWDKYYEALPLELHDLIGETRTLVRKIVIARHPYTTERCGECGQGEHANGERFKICGHCKWIAYCSKECQVKNWKMHAPLCLAKQGKGTVSPINILEPIPPCPCLKGNDKRMWVKQNGICSRRGCNKETFPPHDTAIKEIPCALNTPKKHRLKATFCSAKCRRHAEKEKKRQKK